MGPVTLRALGARVLVRTVEAPPTYGEGLVLRPDEYRDREPGRGVVVSIGPDVGLPDLAVGEFVAFNPLQGSDFRIDGRTFVFVDAGDVLALLPWPDDVGVPETVAEQAAAG